MFLSYNALHSLLGVDVKTKTVRKDKGKEGMRRERKRNKGGKNRGREREGGRKEGRTGGREEGKIFKVYRFFAKVPR